MKLLTFLILAFSFHFASCQSFYVKIGGGYAFPLASEYIGEKHSSTYLRETDPQSGNLVPEFVSNRRVIKGSYTSGVAASATFGYSFSGNIGLELNLSYKNGKKFRSSSLHQDIVDDDIINSSNTSTVTYAKSVIITPSIRLNAARDSRVRPFITAGPAIGFASLNSEYESVSDLEDNVDLRKHEKYSGGISLGFGSTIGLEFTLNDRFSLFSEASILALSYYPNEKKVTKYHVNDEDVLSTLNESQSRTVFVKNYGMDTRTNENAATKPTEELRSSFGMSSVSLLAGIKINL